MNKSADSASPERVSLDQVMRIAELAQLELTPAEQQGMLRDLNSIVGYVDQLNELNTGDVPAMAQVGELLELEPRSHNRDVGHPAPEIPDPAQSSALREDRLRPSLDRSAVMGQAPDSDGTYFKVPKVIER